MDDDFIVIFFAWIAVFCFVLSLFAIAVEDSKPDRIDNICSSLKADRVEDTCIRNGVVVYQD